MKTVVLLFALVNLLTGCGGTPASFPHELVVQQDPHSVPGSSTLLFSNPPSTSAIGTGTITDVKNISDGDLATKTVLTAGGSGADAIVQLVGVKLPSGQSFNSYILHVSSAVPVNTYTFSPSALIIYFEIDGNFHPVLNLGPGMTRVQTLDSIPLPQGVDPTKVLVQVAVTAADIERSGNQVELDIFDVWIEGIP